MKVYNSKEIKDVKRVGIIMWGLIGDVLIRTPILKVLKELYPETNITAIVDPIGEGIVQNNKYVDDVLISKRNANNKIKKQLNKIKNIFDIRKKKFDLIVNLYNAGSSPLVVLCSGARYKLGFCNQKSWHKYVYNIENHCVENRLKAEQSLYNYMISIVEPFFTKNHQFDLRPIFNIPKDTIIFKKKYLQEHVANINKLYTLNLGTSDTKKMLESEKMYSLVKYIYDKYGYFPAVVSNPGQEYLQEDFINNFLKPNELPYLKLETMDFKEIAAVIKLTTFIITHDTGLMHLAMSDNENKIYTIFTYTHPLLINIKHENLIPVYEFFANNKLHSKQNISTATLHQSADLLF